MRTGLISMQSPERRQTDELTEPSQNVQGNLAPVFGEDDEIDQLTVEEKLQAVQLEAEQAKAGMHVNDLPNPESSRLDLEMDDEIGRLRSPAKKSKIKGRPKRRKSTLSPEELENLLNVD